MLLSGAFCALAGLTAYRGHLNPAGYYLAAGLVLAAVTWIAPNVLTPLNRAWMKLGERLGRLMNPLVLGVIFLLVITPLGIVLRIFGRDELRLKKVEGPSFWKPRPMGRSADSFKHQF